MQLAVPNFGFEAGSWRVEKHPRFVTDITGDGRADIVGFGDAGVWVAVNNGDGTFAASSLVLGNFAYDAGGWRVEKHPRMLADVVGDGRPDIVGFGDAGVWIARNTGGGGFADPTLAVANFAFDAGGWRVEKHPRFVTDLTGDGRGDIIGFGDAGVWVALNNGDGSFAAPKLVVENFAYEAGGWRVEKHPRLLADLTGDGRPDIVGFGDAGVWVSYNGGEGTFGSPRRVVQNFAYLAGGWRVEQHPRDVVDLTGDGCADIAGFGDAGVWVELNLGDGTFVQTFVRRNIWELEAAGPWDPVTLAYAKAINAMQARALTDPTSWQYQSAIHGRNGAVPAGAIWNQCQHGSWYFLSWHRMYLYFFERIVRAEVIAQGGPADWALPYWDYDNPGQATLPPAFRQPTMPDGTANPLFVTQRAPGWNAGAQLPPSVVSSSAAMAALTFTPPPAPGFGGGKTTPQHFFGLAGELEFTPHNGVHSLIGGFMGNPNFAALDPIFWLHHANIDRLWAVWLGRGGGRQDPPDPQWQDQAFPFHDETGAQVSIITSETLDTALGLQYIYADVSQVAVVGPPSGLEAAAVREPASGAEPELVGASERPLLLAGAPAAVEIVIDRRSADAARAAVTGPGQVYLNLEDVQAERNPALVYEVFVSVPDAPADVAPAYVGNVSFFGIEHLSATEASGDGPHGFRRTFDITSTVRELRDRGVWDDQRAIVSVRPVAPIPPPGPVSDTDAAAAADAQAAPVRIGRVSVFYG
jgi:hypothetical protein